MFYSINCYIIRVIGGRILENSTLDFLREGKILEIPSDTNYWLVRADGGKYYDDFLLNDFIAVSDNEITLESIDSHPQLNTDIGYTLEGFKSLYQEKYINWNNQQIAHAASRTMKFIEDIKLNDIIIVPSHRSNQFIVGIVTSEVYEDYDIESELAIPVHYSVCPYLKRRKISWIKEVSRNAISEKMYWILSAHQSILQLNDHSEYIDRLLAPIYIKDGFCYGILKVEKREGITSSEWYKLYSVIEEIKGDSSEIIVKSNVESPGYLEILTELSSMSKIVSAMIILSGITFGKVNVLGVEVEGVIPYFWGKGKLERERMKIENEDKQLELELKRMEVENKRRENANLLNIPLERSSHKENTETRAHEVSRELEISAFNVGKTLGPEKRIDSDYSQDEDEPEEL